MQSSEAPVNAIETEVFGQPVFKFIFSLSVNEHLLGYEIASHSPRQDSECI